MLPKNATQQRPWLSTLYELCISHTQSLHDYLQLTITLLFNTLDIPQNVTAMVIFALMDLSFRLEILSFD